MKREASNENGVRRDADTTTLLVIAVLLVVIYFTRGFYIPDNIAPATSTAPVEKTVFEIEDSSGFSKVYTSPKDISLKDAIPKAGDTIIKTGSKITIDKDGSAQIGQMSGEKHIIFSIPIDINRSTAQDFEALSGIGPKLAQEIVDTRERLKGFKSVDDLKKVKGIGDKKLKKIRDKLIS